MQFEIIDTQSIYRRLLAAPDAVAREAIFRDELAAPFAGLAQVFGFPDVLAAFRMWGMWPEQFAPEHHARMSATLDTLAAHDAWPRAVQALERGWAAFAGLAARISLQHIVFALCLCDMGNVPGQRGYSGFGAVPGWIMTVYDQPDSYNLARLEAATVHELHHNLLGVLNPVNMMTATVADYMVMEGLAESFSAELYGEDRIGFWVTDFDESRLEETRQTFASALDKTGFNVLRSYIFGDEITEASGRPKVGVPAFAGYALGYKVVQAYLRRTGQGVAQATLVAPRQIIAESGFFEGLA